MRVPVGITDSSIISCDIGDNVAIHDVHYMANYIVGDNCILFNRKFASHLIFFAVETPSEDAENQWQRLARIRLYERYGYRLAGVDILDNGNPFSVMCRSTATEEDIRKIRAFMEAMGKMTGEDVTIL